MPLVAIVGRPNVGKSTLFNRFAGGKKALVDATPGVTRDLHYANVKFNGRPFTLVDTGGFAMESEDELKNEITQQALLAIEIADVVIMLMDGKEGLTPDDTDVIEILRKRDLPAFYAVNKIDGPKHEALVADFYQLGVEKLYSLSAREKIGIHELFRAVTAGFPKTVEEEPEEETETDEKDLQAQAQRPVRVAFVGKPNVGKSSLVNRILGEPRMIVSSIPGTTTDAIDIECVIDNQKYVLVDTAGIRRKAKVGKKVETFSVVKALQALDRADVACVIMDSTERLADQDLRVVTYAMERGCGILFVRNKIDLTKNLRKLKEDFEEYADYKIRHMNYIPRIYLSALTGKGVDGLFDAIGEVAKGVNIRIGTGELNRLVEQASYRHRPVNKRGGSINILYATQIAVRPPTFLLFMSSKGGLHFSWQRYLINTFRKIYGFTGSPIRLRVRARKKKEKFPEREG